MSNVDQNMVSSGVLVPLFGKAASGLPHAAIEDTLRGGESGAVFVSDRVFAVRAGGTAWHSFTASF